MHGWRIMPIIAITFLVLALFIVSRFFGGQIFAGVCRQTGLRH